MIRISLILFTMILIFLLPACEKENTPPNHSPVASFIASVTSGDRPLEVIFDASQSTDQDDDTLTYQWGFGDGGASSGISCRI